MIDLLKTFSRRFRRETDGYITLEALIVMPALLWLFSIGWVYFDVFRQQSVNQKANYTIGDMLSRETAAVTDDYITNARKLLRKLTRTKGKDSDLRVSVVEFNVDTDMWELVWSEKRGDQNTLKDGDMSDMQDRLPMGIAGDQLILVETWELYQPTFDVGLDPFEIKTYSFTRPRYTPQLVFEDSP